MTQVASFFVSEKSTDPALGEVERENFSPNGECHLGERNLHGVLLVGQLSPTWCPFLFLSHLMVTLFWKPLQHRNFHCTVGILCHPCPCPWCLQSLVTHLPFTLPILLCLCFHPPDVYRSIQRLAPVFLVS
jgi:hypothetical protein